MTLNKTQKIFTLIGFILFLALVVGLILLLNKLYKDSITKETAEVSEQILSVNDSSLREKVIVTDIIDGDTIKVNTQSGEERIRLIGIDTPEMSPKECFAQEATDKLESLILNKEIWLEDDKTQANRDRYQRLLRYIYLDQTIDDSINEFLIKEGYAYQYTYNKMYKYQEDFREAEEYAQDNKLGLWVNCSK
jgi:endonuclease YncB( thermonuclease family)